MYTWKTITPSDYSIREFKAYKDWEFASGSSVLLMNAQNTVIYNDSNTILVTDNFEYNKHSLYGQISASFYSLTDTQIAEGTRKLGNKAKVFSIPNEYIGEGIKPGSVMITDIANGLEFIDNTSGSLLYGSSIVGDIFYNNGIIVYTDTTTVDSRLTGNWMIDFKSIQTITEHEVLISVDKKEYNVSKNPTAVITKNRRWYSLPASKNMEAQSIIVYEGDRYIRKKTKLENGSIFDYRYGSKVITGISGGFEQYSLSASIDTTGSFLTPFVTTIGLYDNSGSLVAVAKLPRPIKMEPILPINFIVRFDV